MIVLFRDTGAREIVFGAVYQPVVIVDYTRSDEQWTTAEIKAAVKAAMPKGAVSTQLLPPSIYSLDYSMLYSHEGITYGDSLKTSFTATISNPPLELVSLLNISQYTSQQNLDALTKAVNSIIDPQVKFPTGKFFIKGPLTAPNEPPEIIARPFIIYSTPFNFDQTRTNSTLTLRGASFDAMVMRLQFALNIDKTKPLIPQIRAVCDTKNITVISSPDLDGTLPAVSKYYAPAPLADLFNEVALDNKLAFDIEEPGFLKIQSLDPDNPPDAAVKREFSFMNARRNTKLISTFSLSNYTTCDFKAEATDVRLFDSVAVYDDSNSPGLFANLSKIPTAKSRVDLPGIGTFIGTTKPDKYPAYRFYVMAYTYTDSRTESSVKITATNNWITSSFKIDSLLENAIYKNAGDALKP